ncbi:MAG TPA: ABC transporter ATP-binding protein [Ktedonobacterales bacterium]|nr:ABC transporter ATP-binding protein [Ktedonobacterales bacterium]
MKAPDKKQPILKVEHLNVDYAASNGTVHAVTDVSFTLHRGEVLGLAGESGSGKSTLAYAISRLLRPPAMITGGKALYYPPGSAPEQGRSSAGRRQAGTAEQWATPLNILDFTEEELRSFRWNDLSIVFQSAMNALNPVMNVGAQIMDVLQTHRSEMSVRERKDRAVELLKLVGIAPDRLKSYPHELSGGMRQRAIIAIALALSPEIIIMDEPTTALDVVVQREILTELLRLREQFHFSVIFITHDLSLLIELADRVAIMYAGRIVEEASQRDLYLRPRHPYSYGLIHSFPTLHGPRRRALGIPGSPPDLRAVPAGCAFHPRCPLAVGACTMDLPLLHPLPVGSDSEAEQQVACHLYDPRFTSVFPTTAAIAEKYEALAEGSGVR